MSAHPNRGFKRTLRALLFQMRERLLASLLDRLDELASDDRPSRNAEPLGQMSQLTGIAIIGCGFVADFYAATLPSHPELQLIGVMDRDNTRASKFGSLHKVKVYESLQDLFDDPQVEIVVNLTNPANHFEISKASLEAGKHVYSEKPLAMTLSEAEYLVVLAERRSLILSSAPCSILGESAQALSEALRKQEVGQVRVVYAELDDGPIHQMRPDEWQSPNGTPWPWQNEFSVGCVLEHSGYHLTWLVAFFGPALSVTAYSSCLISNKHPDLTPSSSGPDFAVACIRFQSGVVARLTCSIVAPHDHSLRIIGDRGILSVDECWHTGTPVKLRRFSNLAFHAESYAWVGRHWLTRALFGLDGRKYAYSPFISWRRRLRRHDMDYLLGVAEVASSAREGRACRLPARLALHVNEVALAIQHAGEAGSSIPIRSTFHSVVA